MIREVYLIRHSKPLKTNNENNIDNLQLQNEKQILSIEGENIAKEKMGIKELENIGRLYSSNYVRAISTAKYIAENNNIDINIISDFGERKFGVDSWDELPNNFGENQLFDENYKLENGESQKEVRERVYNSLMKILRETSDKRIAIVFHSTAMLYLLKIWCEIDIKTLELYFNGKKVFNGKFDYCETFKLIFDNEKIVSIENI